MGPNETGSLLKKFREDKGLSRNVAAAQLCVSRTALSKWEEGWIVPSLLYRDAIEKWSDGVVKAEAWGLSKVESRIANRLGLTTQ